MITLIGFFAIIFQYSLVAYYHPKLDGTEAAPSWVYFVQAAGIWFYQTMDALDGKQARRTGTSSPLGELFDHGCDAMTTAFLVIVAAAATGMPATSLLLPILLMGCAVFFLAQWEEYNTDSFILGPINVTEAQFVLMALNIWTGLVGPQWWQQTIAVAGFSFAYTEILCIVNVTIQGLTALGNLYKGYFNALPAKRAGSLTRLFPIVALVAGAFAWTSSSNLLRLYPHETCVMIGFLSAGIVGRIVVARVCELQLSWFQPILIPFIVGAANSAYLRLWPADDISYLYLCLVLAVGAYLDYALGIIDQMTGHLGIRCLQIDVHYLNPAASYKLAGKSLLQFPSLKSATAPGTPDNVVCTATVRPNKTGPLFGYSNGVWVLLEQDSKPVLSRA